MRARYPDSDGLLVRDGVEIRYERYGEGQPAILLLPTWSLVHSRHWKMQIPYLARHFTVVCFDGRGSGGSSRPADASAYSDVAFASDALAVMDAAGIDSAVAHCHAVPWAPHGRDPVKVIRLITELTERITGASMHATTWTRGACRPARALYLSSPIGLGHVRRDVAVASELRERHPGLEIDWLAQHPVTTVLEASGERIHPASAQLASESGHIESESAGHDLHCFGAWRRMDEILVANFMVFHDLARQERYDLWIGDEAWELDYYLHENPELKSAAFAWLTDFVGYLPMPAGGEREAFLTADYNAEMIEHIARYPRVRDRAVFVGDARPTSSRARSAPGCRRSGRGPSSTTTSSATSPASTHVSSLTGKHSATARTSDVCLVTVGGSGVGGHLLHRVIAAFPEPGSGCPACG